MTESDKDFRRDITTSLKTTGKPRTYNEVNVIEMFMTHHGGRTPNVLNFLGTTPCDYNWDKLIENLQVDYKPQVLFQEENKVLDSSKKYYTQQVILIKKGIIAYLYGYNDRNEKTDYINTVSYSYFLVDGSMSKEDEEKLSSVYNNSLILEKSCVNIGMVSQENGHYYVKNFDIKNSILDLELFDLHYGEGFNDFYSNVMERLLTTAKGLTLFHGSPGTGKTTIIRNMIRDLVNKDKNNKVLYFPPTMIDFITEPSFINFISNWVSENNGKTYLLIEDAEPLLESRDNSRNMGITNLLNLTDGILNDILSIQIIATFNTKLQNLDPALLRPGRLLARKEFKNLSVEDSIKLGEHLNIDKSLIKGEMSVAEIYSLNKDTKPLTHDIKIKKNKLGFE